MVPGGGRVALMKGAAAAGGGVILDVVWDAAAAEDSNTGTARLSIRHKVKRWRRVTSPAKSVLLRRITHLRIMSKSQGKQSCIE